MNATEWLKRDHTLILEALDLLQKMMDAAAAGSAIPEAKAREMLDFFRSFADDYHHHKEEAALFPALESAGLVAPVTVMTSEHKEGRDLLRSLEEALPMLSLPTPEHEVVADIARTYSALLRDHIQKENEVLFRMADRVLMPSEDAEITEAFADLDRSQPAGGAFVVYKKRIEGLRAWLDEALSG